MLDAAERLALAWPWLRQRVLAAHRGAIAAVLRDEPAPRSIAIVGGGLFPRSAILLRELYPNARLVVVDGDAAHLATAAAFLPARVECQTRCVSPGDRLDVDLVVLPLALRGSRERFLQQLPAERVVVHDWLWNRQGRGAVVAFWLAKRVYVLRGEAAPVLVRG